MDSNSYWVPFWRSKFETMLDKTRSHLEGSATFKIIGGGSSHTGCSDQCPLSVAFGLLPFICGNDDLRTLATQDIRAQNLLPHWQPIILGDIETERGSGIVMPNF
jgi:hypothetical protein